MNRGPVSVLLRGMIRLYGWFISPLLGPHCRHLPTCSQYALAAIERYGALRGSWLALGRLARCHPWGTSGYDPVPHTWKEKAPAEQHRLITRRDSPLD